MEAALGRNGENLCREHENLSKEHENVEQEQTQTPVLEHKKEKITERKSCSPILVGLRKFRESNVRVISYYLIYFANPFAPQMQNYSSIKQCLFSKIVKMSKIVHLCIVIFIKTP